MSGNILLIDTFSAVSFLATELKKYGLKTTAIFTYPKELIPSYYTLSPELFDEQLFINSKDPEVIIKMLGDRRFDYIINGFEKSVPLSDSLARHYTPQYQNDLATTEFRFNKYLVQDLLAKHNLPTIKQSLFHYQGHIPDITKRNLTYPCFIKPLFGAASIGSANIYNYQDLANYFGDTEFIKNNLIANNEQNNYIIAEKITGTEYFVDTFSVNNQHFISSIQVYHKERTEKEPIVRYSELATDNIEKITTYVKQLLTISGQHNGFAHTELFVTNDNEIKLIEINSRISGAGGTPNIVAQIEGFPSQVDLLVSHIFNIKPLLAQSKSHARLMVLYGAKDQIIANMEQKLSQWPTVYLAKQLVANGYTQTTEHFSLLNAIALVVLKADNLSTIEKNYEEILACDRLGWPAA